MAERPSDFWVLPLCPSHHREGPDAQHKANERDWWKRHGINPLPICALLFLHSGSLEEAEAVIRNAKLIAPWICE